MESVKIDLQLETDELIWHWEQGCSNMWSYTPGQQHGWRWREGLIPHCCPLSAPATQHHIGRLPTPASGNNTQAIVEHPLVPG